MRDTRAPSLVGLCCTLGGVIAFGVPWRLLPGPATVAAWARPEIALAAGIALGLLGLTALEKQCKSVSRLLIQLIVVLVGFRIDLGDVVRFGGLGLGLGTGVILTTFVAGVVLAKAIRTQREVTTLLCSGTAICGGSAIAAVGSAIGASAAPMAVALGCVFVLNAVALYLTPAIGQWLSLSSPEFGTWAGLAIHDYSSVLAAARAWDEAHGGGSSGALANAAEQAATVTKGARVLWIAPIAVGAAWWARRAGRAEAHARLVSPVPWFILGFLAASTLRTSLPAETLPVSGTVILRRDSLSMVSKHVTDAAMPLALFLIGTSLSRATLRAVGWRALVVGASLWVMIGAASLVAVRALV